MRIMIKKKKIKFVDHLMDMCFDGLFKNHHTVLFGRLINYYVEIN